MNIVTYKSDNAPENKRWAAYVVLPNGEYWGIMFTGSTEDEVRFKAEKLWTSERARSGLNQMPSANNPWVSAASSPLPSSAGFNWLVNKLTRVKSRVSDEKAAELLATGEYERGGPRSK